MLGAKLILYAGFKYDYKNLQQLDNPLPIHRQYYQAAVIMFYLSLLLVSHEIKTMK